MTSDPEQELTLMQVATEELRHRAHVSGLAFQQNAASLAGLEVQVKELRVSVAAMKAAAVTLLSEYGFVQRTLAAKVNEIAVLLQTQRQLRRDILKYSREADIMKKKVESRRRSMPVRGVVLEFGK